MVAINTSGTTNPEDYSLGRGIASFAPLGANSLPMGYRDLGNSPNFTTNVTKEELEHRSSRGGLKTIDKTVTVSRDVGLTFDLEEINQQNLAAFFSANVAVFINAAVAGFTQYTAYEGVFLGHSYDIRDSNGLRAYDINAADITVAVVYPAATLVLDTDYTVDTEMGTIFLMPGSTDVADGDNIQLTLTAKAGARAVNEIRGLTRSSILGSLKFLATNPASDSTERTEYVFHKVELSSEGDLALIGDDWGVLSFTGKAQANAIASPYSPTVSIRSLAPA